MVKTIVYFIKFNNNIYTHIYRKKKLVIIKHFFKASLRKMHDFDKSPDDDNDDDIELLIIVLKVVIHYLNLPTEIEDK